MAKDGSSHSLTRNDLIGLIWACVIGLILDMSGIVGFSGLAASVSFGDLLPVFGIALVTAAVSTSVIVRHVPDTTHRPATRDEDDTHSDKAKNDQLTLNALNLLTDEDLEELRAEMKQRLRERMLSAGEGELTPLDSLLAEQEHRARR